VALLPPTFIAPPLPALAALLPLLPALAALLPLAPLFMPLAPLFAFAAPPNPAPPAVCESSAGLLEQAVHALSAISHPNPENTNAASIRTPPICHLLLGLGSISSRGSRSGTKNAQCTPSFFDCDVDQCR
jgi:hypothetical protein